ncbi:putative zinc-binding protein [Caldimonas manganoxidans]|jgi:uncharacterized metal-binding protein|uniref:putative zinc-binding protein n=1 Tax=Caldimonas manganoxidans TaxID=196015 RepID=UPI0003766055|nr:putative zinc-binding protein [Caldimonas manganoxidans]
MTVIIAAHHQGDKTDYCQAQDLISVSLAIDGCALACVRHSLARHGIAPTAHVQLGEQGVRKTYHADFDVRQAEVVYLEIRERVQAMNALAAPGSSGGSGTGACRCAGA